MKKTSTRKLGLDITTIRSLSLPEASKVRGGLARPYPPLSSWVPLTGGDGIWCPPPDPTF